MGRSQLPEFRFGTPHGLRFSLRQRRDRLQRETCLGALEAIRKQRRATRERHSDSQQDKDTAVVHGSLFRGWDSRSGKPRRHPGRTSSFYAICEIRRHKTARTVERANWPRFAVRLPIVRVTQNMTETRVVMVTAQE